MAAKDYHPEMYMTKGCLHDTRGPSWNVSKCQRKLMTNATRQSIYSVGREKLYPAGRWRGVYHVGNINLRLKKNDVRYPGAWGGGTC